jgi:branched-chain amino acid transport system substrate-binding protein
MQTEMFTTMHSDSASTTLFQGVTMANFASQNLSAKSAVIIQDTSSDYGKGLAKNFKETFTKNGGTIVAEKAL